MAFDDEPSASDVIVWERRSFQSFEEALQAVVPEADSLVLYPIFVHSDYRKQLWHIVEKRVPQLEGWRRNAWSHTEAAWREACSPELADDSYDG